MKSIKFSKKGYDIEDCYWVDNTLFMGGWTYDIGKFYTIEGTYTDNWVRFLSSRIDGYRWIFTYNEDTKKVNLTIGDNTWTYNIAEQFILYRWFKGYTDCIEFEEKVESLTDEVAKIMGSDFPIYDIFETIFEEDKYGWIEWCSDEHEVIASLI